MKASSGWCYEHAQTLRCFNKGLEKGSRKGLKCCAPALALELLAPGSDKGFEVVLDCLFSAIQPRPSGGSKSRSLKGAPIKYPLVARVPI